MFPHGDHFMTTVEKLELYLLQGHMSEDLRIGIEIREKRNELHRVCINDPRDVIDHL